MNDIKLSQYPWDFSGEVLGKTPAGQEILLGGMSGLFFEKIDEQGKLHFIATPDRGPNGEPTDVDGDGVTERPFALPDYQARLIRFTLDRTTGEIEISQRIFLTQEDGVTPITGLPNIQAGVKGSAYTDEEPVDLFGTSLENDPLGVDTESIIVAPDGTFWLSDEYRPSIYHFDETGRLIERFVPVGTASAVGEEEGTFGEETLPAVYAQRRANRGFEGMALDRENNKLYAWIQSPIDNPDVSNDANSKASQILRILEVDANLGEVTGEYVYLLSGFPGVDKIGDAVYQGDGKFLVIERDSGVGEDANKFIFEVDLGEASNILGTELANATDKGALEQKTAEELAALGIVPVSKTEVLNLPEIGYLAGDKPEGLALLPNDSLAVINDNDFGLLDQEIPQDGSVPFNPDPTQTVLGIIEFAQMNEPFTLQLLHAADQEAGIPALDDAPRFSAVLNALRNEDADGDGEVDYANTITLSSGDAFIPGLFLDASADPALAALLGGEGKGRADIIIQNELGFQAIALGNHEFDLGTEFLAGLIAPDGDYRGAQFPYLSSNLDFSTDANLAGLVREDGQEAKDITNSLAKSTVITVNGEKIGVVGATTPTLGTISSPGDVGILPENPTDIAALAAEIQKSVDELTARGINKVILLAHMQQIAIEEELATLLTDVDIIVAGGSNTRLVDETDRLREGDDAQGVYPILSRDAEGSPIAIVNTDGNYKYVGRLVVDFDAEGNIIPVSIDPNISGAYATDDQGVADLKAEDLVDPEIQAITDTLREVIIQLDSNTFGITEVFLNGTRSDVRTQETNLGNLTADANLAIAQEIDPTVVISLKNGGGIRDNIGRIFTPPGAIEPIKLPPEGNELTGTPEGAISQLSIQNALRFNNGLTLLTVTAAELEAIIEHGVAETGDGNTPGRFPQVSGIAFSFDDDLPAGDRVVSLAITNEDDTIADVIVENGELVGDPDRTFRLVTLNFLANGGDGYPFPDRDRVDLAQSEEAQRTGIADFAPDGTEQDALAEYLAANFTADNPFKEKDVAPELDTRIQNLDFRQDTVLGDTSVPQIIAQQTFNDLEGSALTTDSLPDGSQLTNSGSFNDDSSLGLTFATFWFDTRGVGLGSVTLTNDSSDFIGVNTFTGNNAPNVAPDGTNIGETEKNFEFNDGDGRLDLVFAPVDLSGFSNRILSFDYWINDTGYERNDAFFFTLSDEENSRTFLNFGETELEANVSSDDGTANWNSVSVDLEELIEAGFGEELTLTISVDNNAGSENIFVDNIIFASGADKPETVPIYEIQGESHTSTFVGEEVITTGIVTAVDSRGFYLQDARGDGNDNTSDGIFVFTNSTPTVSVGDGLQVQGTVSEFIPGGASTNNLSITQISGNLTITTISTENELPTPVILGEAGRIAPNQIIDNDNLAEFDPTQDGIDFYETVEGMLVTIPDALAVSGTNRFGEIFTLSDNGDNATGLSERGTINISPADFNPERIQVQFDRDILPDFWENVNVGDSLGDVTGVVSYSFGNYEVLTTEEFSPTSANLEPETTELSNNSNKLTIASYNVLNLDPNAEDGDDDVGNGRFTAIASHIVNNLNSPDILGLQEIQDNNGAESSEIFAADETLQLLVEEISAISGIEYEFIDNPFIGNNTSGGQPGGNIRTTFLYNPERVSVVEDSVTTVTDPTDQQTNPENPFFDSRLPLVASFEFKGKEITVVNNHWSSKGGSSPLFGQIQPSTELQEDPNVNGSLDERQAQSAVVKAFVDDILKADSEANVVVLGDLNEFEFISPVTNLTENLTNLTETLPENERYSFIFQGNSQSLDHILVSDNLAESSEFDIVHVNTEFAETPNRASDHDPLLVEIKFTATVLEGTTGRDEIIGTDADEQIVGLQGRDILTGNDGVDEFIYTSVLDGGDTITDFEPGIDKLNFIGLLESINYQGDDPIADGVIRLGARSMSESVISIDPDGLSGNARPRIFLLLENVPLNDLVEGDNFIF